MDACTVEATFGKQGAILMAIPAGQADWRFCNKCYSLYWNGDPNSNGHCAAGGAHDATGSWDFLLPANPVGYPDE
jgi:hypothetical protein